MKPATVPSASGHFPTLSRILAPLTPEEFLSTYFEKRALFIRGEQGKFSHLFSAELFKLGLDRVTEIRAVFGELRQATIDPADIKDMFEVGASICVTGMEEAHPTLKNAATQLKRELGYGGKISFRAYFSPPGEGFDIHFDARVATTLQIAGTKRWWYSDEPVIPFPEGNSPRNRDELAAEFKVPKLSKLNSVLLKPGDLLCLPAGCWHRAKAESSALALNLAFDHAGGSVLDVIISAIEDELRTHPQWRQPLPVEGGMTNDQIPQRIEKVLQSRIDEMVAMLTRLRDNRPALESVWKRSFSQQDQ